MTPTPAAFRLPPAACLLALAMILIAGGCRDGDTAATQSATARSSATTAEGQSKTGAGRASRCPEQLHAFVASLDGLRRRLAVGLSYEQYVTEVKGLRVAYREIPVRRLTLGCLATGRPSEKALNKHIDAANAWGECLAEAACTTTAIEPVLQRKWRIASRHLSEAG